jgi:hypothetical protein
MEELHSPCLPYTTDFAFHGFASLPSGMALVANQLGSSSAYPNNVMGMNSILHGGVPRKGFGMGFQIDGRLQCKSLSFRRMQRHGCRCECF